MTDLKAVFEYPSKILDITEKNESFDSCTIRIMYPGLNRKGIIFDKAVIEKAIPSIYYCPVVTNYDIQEDSFGGHDVDIVKREDGSIRMVNLTDGIGVIPNEAEYFWDMVTEDNGEEHEYLCVNAILWKRSAAYEKIKRDGFAAHSMEIAINAYHKTDEGMVVDDFTFEAFTVIGVEPCFESSGVYFSLDLSRDSLSEMLEDYKKAFALVNPSEVPTLVDDTILAKGGKEQLDIAGLLAEFNLTEADINFDMEGMSEEEIRARFAEITQPEQTASPEEPVSEDQPTDQTFSLTASEIEAQIMNALSTETFIDPYWHEETMRYWYQDRDDAVSEIYLYDRQNKYVVGVTYTMNGDNVTIDFDGAKRKRIQYVDFNDGEAQDYVIFDVIQKDAESHFDALKSQIDELSKFKADTEAAQAENEAQSVFAMFPDLQGNAAFEAIVANHIGMNSDAIKKECYAIRGMSVTPAKFSMSDKPNRVPVEPDKTQEMNDDEPYHGLFSKYL